MVTGTPHASQDGPTAGPSSLEPYHAVRWHAHRQGPPLREALANIEALPEDAGEPYNDVERGRLIGWQDGALIARRALSTTEEAAP